MSRNLTVHFKRRVYLVTQSRETLALGDKMVRVHEWDDGSVELRCEGRVLPYTIFDTDPIVGHAAVVENKRLGTVLAVQASQTERDRKRLTGKKLTLREKERLRAARTKAGVSIPERRPTPTAGHFYLAGKRTFLLGFDTWGSS